MKNKLPRVRIMKIEKAKYSLEKPNPEWKIKGEKWINFALLKWNEGEAYDVAYIPHVPIEILLKNKIHNIIPTKWDSEEISNAANFYMGGGNNQFRLNARYKNPNNRFVGSKKNIDLKPDIDREIILDLLKMAEKIYDPPK